MKRALLIGSVFSFVLMISLACGGQPVHSQGASSSTGFEQLPSTEMPELLALGLPASGDWLAESPWVRYSADGTHSAPLNTGQSYTASGDLKVIGDSVYNLVTTGQVLKRDGLAPDAPYVVIGSASADAGEGAAAIAVDAAHRVHVLSSANSGQDYSAVLGTLVERPDIDGSGTRVFIPTRAVDSTALGLEIGPDGVFYSLSRPFDGAAITTLLRFTESEDLAPVALATPIPIHEPTANRHVPFQDVRAQLRLEGDWLIVILHEELSFTKERWQTIVRIHTGTGDVRKVQGGTKVP